MSGLWLDKIADTRQTQVAITWNLGGSHEIAMFLPLERYTHI